MNELKPALGQVVKSGGERYEVLNKGATALKAGDPVSLIAGAGNNIQVEKNVLAANTTYGIVVHEPFYAEHKQNKNLTVARNGSHIVLAVTEGEDVKRGDKVQFTIDTAAIESTVEALDAGKSIGVAVSDAEDGLVIVELAL